VFGKDISENMGDIRHVMGVCPQHDVLWDDLTVKEHLNFFAGLKGVPKEKIADSVAKIIAEVGLTEKIDVQSRALSGGMKRKLSVAIALIGDSKVVFLDEPTSGRRLVLLSYACEGRVRRHCWWWQSCRNGPVLSPIDVEYSAERP
jgi:ATP-binding cassette, subfamily A (ABC1), member 3